MPSYLGMARPPRRYVPDRLYEATIKTFQARYFLVPSRMLNALLVGVLAYAQAKFNLRICYVVALSNHLHILYRGSEKEDVSGFFCLANSQISKEVQRLCDWTGGIFRRRFTVTEVTSDPAAQVARLKYLMSQGTKEGLVPHPTLWPGVQSASAWLDGSMELRGTWINRSELYELERSCRRKPLVKRRRFSKKALESCTDRVVLELSPLPCCDGWTVPQLVGLAKRLCDEILEEHADKRSKICRGWRKRLMDVRQFCFRPTHTKRGDRPTVHAASEEDWIAWVREWEEWKATYRRASMRLRRGIAAALGEFPEGAFVPSGIFTTRVEVTALPPPS